MPVVVKHRCPQDHPYPCVRLCPADAVSQKGYDAPHIDRNKCIDCGACINYCPYQAMTELEPEKRKRCSAVA